MKPANRPAAPPPDGPYEEHFADGSLACRGQHRDGQKTGEWRYFLKNGRLKAVGHYRRDQIHGEWQWYRENGELMQTGAFTDGRRCGVWRRYRPDGSLLDEGAYDGEDKIGEWKTCDAHGRPVKVKVHKPRAAAGNDLRRPRNFVTGPAREGNAVSAENPGVRSPARSGAGRRKVGPA